MSTPATHSAPSPAPDRLRFVTAASLFDGHDASINIMRRMLQAAGVEVVHLGHNRSVAEIVTAAIQEDAHGIAVSSYQGGHVEFFQYMMDCLREQGAADICVFGGGGGVIVAEEIDALHRYGVARIYSPQDGQTMGLQGMIDHMIESTSKAWSGVNLRVRSTLLESTPAIFDRACHAPLARLISLIENDELTSAEQQSLLQRAAELDTSAPVLGITGTGGSGKSSVTDELIRRLRLDQRDSVAVTLLAIDPTRRKTGGALLGDRIRMNAIEHEKIFMHSLATRDAVGEVPAALPLMIAACRLAGADLVIVETPGIGQGDAGIVSVCDVSLYVMTPEFGAASQLEKIDMLDYADVIAINKLERKGGEDALRDVRKQVQRNRQAFAESADAMPVFGTIAARFNDDGVTALYHALSAQLRQRGLALSDGRLPLVDTKVSTRQGTIIPSGRQRYLSDIADSVREYHAYAEAQACIARERQQLSATRTMLAGVAAGANKSGDKQSAANDAQGASLNSIDALIAERDQKMDNHPRQLLDEWPERVEQYSGTEMAVTVGDKTKHLPLTTETLCGTQVRKVALPRFQDHGDLLSWMMRENLPGFFPYTAGVFAFKRTIR